MNCKDPSSPGSQGHNQGSEKDGGNDKTRDAKQHSQVLGSKCKAKISPIIYLLFIALGEIAIYVWILSEKLAAFPRLHDIGLFVAMVCIGAVGVHNVIKSNEFQENYLRLKNVVWIGYLILCIIMLGVFVASSRRIEPPQFSVVPASNPIDRTRFKPEFVIENTGTVSAFNVQWSLVMHKVILENNNSFTSVVSRGPEIIPRMDVGDKVTAQVPSSLNLPSPATSADIEIVIMSYTESLSIRHTNSVRFYGTNRANGFSWYYLPLLEKAHKNSN